MIGANVVYSVYPGLDRSDPHSETRSVHGPLFEQIRAIEDQLAAQAPMVFDKEDPTTPNMVKYPLRALKEAVVNALIHRDYEVSHPVRITVFSDRVEIVSPGAMPVEVDRTEFLAGRATPVWRNQDLAMFCIKQRVAENQGQGVATIFRTMREAGCPPPEFQLGEHGVRCVLRANPRTIRAGLLVGFDASFLPPASLGLASVVEIPTRSSPIDWSRLRSVPIDAPTWEAAMDEIDHGLERVLEASHGDLHVLVMAPYAVAAFLGRRLVDMARARPVHLYQVSPRGGGWDAFSRPREAPAQPSEPYFERLREPTAAPAVSAVLLAIDGAHPIPEGRRDRLAEHLGAAAYHLQSRSPEPMHPAQMPGAAVALRQALAVIGRQHPGIPLHVIISAPVALAIELGRQITAAVFPSAIVHHFDVASAAYVPVLDVVQCKVVSADLTP